MTSDRVFDPGLQPERTALSWQRTTLSFAVAALVTVRLVAHESGPLAIAVGGASIAAVVGVLAAGHLRYRRVHSTLTASESDRVPFHTAGWLLGWTVLTAVIALLGLGMVLLRLRSIGQ